MKSISLGKVGWHNLLEQFPHISTTNFAILFSSENLKEKMTIFKNCNFFCQACFLHSGIHPANIRLDEDLLKTSFVFRRRLDQDEHVCLSLTSSKRLGQDQYIRLGRTSSRRFQDVSHKRLQDVLKTSSRRIKKRLQDIFKTSWRRFEKVFKTYHQVKLFLLTRLWEAFNTFLRSSFPNTVIYRGIC